MRIHRRLPLIAFSLDEDFGQDRDGVLGRCRTDGTDKNRGREQRPEQTTHGN